VYERLTHAEGVAVAHTSSEDAAENVAPASVGGEHAVAYEGNGGACVVGYDLSNALSPRFERAAY
jgi:hypothetical protein